MHSECEGHEQRAVRGARDLRVPVQAIQVSIARRKHRGCDRVPGCRWRCGRQHVRAAIVGSISGSSRNRSQYSRNDCATAASSTMWPTFEWPKIPFSVRLVEPVHTAAVVPLAQDEELVVHQPAVGAPLAHGLDSRLCDGFPISLPRPARLAVFVASLAVVVQDRDLRSAQFRLPQCLQHRGPLEFVHRAVDLPAAAGASDKRNQRFQQPSGQPVVRRRPRLAWLSVIEASRIFLRCHRTAIEERRVSGASLQLRRDLDGDARARLQSGRVAVPCHDVVRVGPPGLGAVVRPLKALNRMEAGRKPLTGTRMRLGLLESFKRREPDCFVLCMIGAPEGEPSELRSLR